MIFDRTALHSIFLLLPYIDKNKKLFNW